MTDCLNLRLTRRALLSGLGAGVMAGGLLAGAGRAAWAAASSSTSISTSIGGSGPDQAGFRRIVTLGAPVSELVEALVGADRIVGVDTTTTFPPSLQGKPRTGYLRQLAAEGVLSLQPDLILAQHDAGPPEVLAQLRAAGVKVEQLPAAVDSTGLVSMVRQCATLLRAEQAGQAVLDRVQADLAVLPGAASETGPRILFLLVGHSAPLGAGRQTPIDGLIAMAGGRNALAGQDGWKPVSAEAMVALNPDALLVSEQALTQLGGVPGLQALPLLVATPAARLGRVFTVEASLLQGLGVRSPAAALTLARHFRELAS